MKKLMVIFIFVSCGIQSTESDTQRLYFFNSKIISKEKLSSFLNTKTKVSFVHIDVIEEDLSNIDFSKTTIALSDFSAANLSGVDLRYTDVSGTSFKKANLVGAKLWGIQGLDKRQFRGAKLSYFNKHFIYYEYLSQKPAINDSVAKKPITNTEEVNRFMDNVNKRTGSKRKTYAKLVFENTKYYQFPKFV